MKHGITAALPLITCSQSLPVVAQIDSAKEAHKAESIGVVGGLATLSQRRVEAVVKKLQGMSLSDATFHTLALEEHEPASADESLESNFFDRRVVLRLSEDRQALLSSAGH